jgi:acetyl esterase/lipase
LALTASAACWPAATLAAGSRAVRPAEDFAALPAMEGPLLSPGGRLVAGKVDVKGEQFLAISALDGEAPPRVAGTAGEVDINWWRWVNDEWLVVGVGALDEIDGNELYIRRVIGLRADAGKMVPLAFREAAQGADDVIWIAGDGSPRIRLALQKSAYLNDPGFWPEVIEVDVSTGRFKRVLRSQEGVTSWYADGSGTVRVGVGESDEGRSSRLLYRKTDEDRFKTLDRAKARKGEKLLLPSLFLAEPGQALAIDDKDGFDAVYKLDLESLTLGDRLFGAPGHDIDGIIADPTGSRLLGVALIEDARRIHWLDPELADLQAKVDASVPGRRALLVSADRQRRRLLYHVGAADQPGGYYLLDRADGKLKPLAWLNSRIGAAQLHPVQSFRYRARDGLEISAVLTLPAGRPAEGLPLVVMPHGGPFSRDYEEWDWWSQFLAERGYGVVQPNYRGSSGFGTAFALKGEGQWGLAMQDDLNDALLHLARKGIADPKRACIVGGSYGGYAAMRAAQRDGSLYRCAVSFAGVSDLAAMLKFDARFFNTGRARDWVRAQAPDLAAVSPINFPEQFTAPVLLVHGRKDRRVPVKQSREMAEKLTRAGKTVRYVEQPLGDHHLSREEDRLGFLKALESFLAEHNPA